jgi:hypothetical protein|tara:strand:- start:53 stop:283 length:231 start_codon:yes stop_codon:yes gene_type:complete
MVVVLVEEILKTQYLEDRVVVLDMRLNLVVLHNQVFRSLDHILETVMEILVGLTEVVMLVVEEAVLEVRVVPLPLE